MDKFNNNALSLIKQAVFQNKPFILLTIETEELNASYRGNENALVHALTRAMDHDSDIARIVRRAYQHHTANNLQSTTQKIKVQ